MVDLQDLQDEILKKGKWYFKYRGWIWGAVWFCVGLFGGNADRIKGYIPTLQYSTPEIQQKLQKYDELKQNYQKIRKELDEAQVEVV